MRKLRVLPYTKWYNIMKQGFITNNPIFSMGLGVCSALAITNRVENAIAMGLSVTFVTIASSLVTSSIRRFIPSRVRMVTYMVIIATFVIAVDAFLKAYYPSISEALGPYVGLIITNCMVMGRAEAFAIKNSTGYSLLDAVSNGLGYTFTLIMVAVVREVLAFGTVLGYRVVAETFTNWVVMAMAPGGFFVLAIFIWIMRSVTRLSDES